MNRYGGYRPVARQRPDPFVTELNNRPANTATSLSFPWSEDSNDYLIGNTSVCAGAVHKEDIERMLSVLRRLPTYQIPTLTCAIITIVIVFLVGLVGMILILSLTKLAFLIFIPLLGSLILACIVLVMAGKAKETRMANRREQFTEAFLEMKGSIFGGKNVTLSLSPLQSYISLTLPGDQGAPAQPTVSADNTPVLPQSDIVRPVHMAVAPNRNVNRPNLPYHSPDQNGSTNLPPLDTIDMNKPLDDAPFAKEQILQGIRAPTLEMKTVSIEERVPEKRLGGVDYPSLEH